MKIIDTIKIAICSNENLSLEKRVDCIEYINKLQQENKELKERINTYENPEDLTLFYMWLDEKAKDKIKELKNRINKAIAYIENQKDLDEDCYYRFKELRQIEDLLKILNKKEDKE